MSYNGSGTFQINSSGQPVVAETLIEAATFNAFTADVATGLSNAICKDGQTTVTANIPFGGYKLTGVGAATARTDAATLASIQDGTGVYVATVGGTADVITLTAAPAITAYAAGQRFSFIASGANTTNVTVNISSLGAKALTKNGTTALAANDITSGSIVDMLYDGTRFILLSVTRQFLPITGGTLTGNLLFTDATYDIGASGATRPRDFFLSRNATIGGTLGVTGAITATAGQIAFPATQSASSDANTLDDYEEGSWTPAVTFTTPGNLSIAYSAQLGRYTKIGKQVTLWFYIVTSTFTHTTASGTMTITGIPFNIVASPSMIFPGSLQFAGITKASYTQFTPIANLSFANNTIEIMASASGSANSYVAAADMPTAGTVTLAGCVMYEATA